MAPAAWGAGERREPARSWDAVHSLSICHSSFFLCYRRKLTWLVLCVKARTHADGAKEPFTLFNKN